MNVLYVIDSLAASGAERSLTELIGPLRARGISIEVAYLHERPGLRAELEAMGTALWRVRSARGASVLDLARLIRRRRPDMVHTTLFEADIAGRLGSRMVGTPVVSSLVNVAYGPEHYRIPTISASKLRAAQLVDAATARLTIRLHAISKHVARIMGRRLRYPIDRIDVVARGRDPGPLGSRTPERRADARRRLTIPCDAPAVLAAARQEHQKGLDVLLQAFATLRVTFPDAILLIAGRSGASTPRLFRAALDLRLGDSVRFLGPRSDVPDLMCSADLFVLPSRWEGLGSVLLEAMALEAPIVASDLPAVREVVTDGDTAVLVPMENSMALAEATVSMLKDVDMAARLAQRARARFLGTFTIDRVADQMASFYARTLAEAS